MREILGDVPVPCKKGYPYLLATCFIHREGIVEGAKGKIDLINGDQFLIVQLSLLWSCGIIINNKLDLMTEKATFLIDIVLPQLIALLE